MGFVLVRNDGIKIKQSQKKHESFLPLFNYLFREMGVHSENKSNTTTVELDQGELDTSMISFDLVLNVTGKYLLILSITTN
jgi:hypothetical protein